MVVESGILDTANTRPTELTAGAAAHEKNTTWTAVLNSAGANATGIIIEIAEGNLNVSPTTFLVDIGIGPTTPTVLVPNLIFKNSSSAEAMRTSHNKYYFPIAIASGSKLWARAQCEISGSRKCRVAVKLCRDPHGLIGGTSVVAYGGWGAYGTGGTNYPGEDSPNQIGNTTIGAQMPQIASGYGYGSWAELTPSSATLKGFSISVCHGSGTQNSRQGAVIDIGQGAASSEAAFLKEFYVNTNAEYRAGISPYLSLPIPSGTRLSGRFKGRVNVSPVMSCILYGVV